MRYAQPTYPLNTDGFNVAGTNIVIENSWIKSYDDAVTIKGSWAVDGVEVCTDNVVVRNLEVSEHVVRHFNFESIQIHLWPILFAARSKLFRA